MSANAGIPPNAADSLDTAACALQQIEILFETIRREAEGARREIHLSCLCEIGMRFAHQVSADMSAAGWEACREASESTPAPEAAAG